MTLLLPFLRSSLNCYIHVNASVNEIGSPPVPAKPMVPVLGSLITPLDLNGTVGWLLESVRSGTSTYACIANVHTVTLAIRDEQFSKALNGAAIVVADGMPVVWRVRAAGYPEAGRVYGADLVEATCAAGIPAGLRHGFFGGLDGVAESMAVCLKRRYPSIKITGFWNPGAVQPHQPTPQTLLDAINDSDCDVLWVGLGAPKQEIWMAQHRPHLKMPVIVGVGQAFNLIAGRTSRPPEWMGSHGLEWVYRLIHEPHRLWKRYLVYNSLFLWYLLRERLGFNSDHTQG